VGDSAARAADQLGIGSLPSGLTQFDFNRILQALGLGQMPPDRGDPHARDGHSRIDAADPRGFGRGWASPSPLPDCAWAVGIGVGGIALAAWRTTRVVSGRFAAVAAAARDKALQLGQPERVRRVRR
jgi:hypothetical protein